MGPRTTASMLGGAVLGYAVLGPLARAKGWAPGPIEDFETGATGMAGTWARTCGGARGGMQVGQLARAGGRWRW